MEDLLREILEELRGLRADLASRADTPRGLVDTKWVATRYGVRPEWVRAHKTELGAIPIGRGERPRLRFDPAITAESIRNLHHQPARKRKKSRRGEKVVSLHRAKH